MQYPEINMRKLLVFLILIVTAYLAAKYFGWPSFSPHQNSSQTLVQEKPKISIKGNVFEIEIADTDDKRSRGLSGRQKLEPNAGMLFAFSDKDTYSFWMKDMKFALDFIWIEDTKIVDLTENVPPPITATYLPPIRPKQPVNYVLEINAGLIKKYDIKIGDPVMYIQSLTEPNI